MTGTIIGWCVQVATGLAIFFVGRFGVMSLGESSIDFAVRPWARSSDYWPTLYALNQRIKEPFDREGVSIPFPQHDVHLFPTGQMESAG